MHIPTISALFNFGRKKISVSRNGNFLQINISPEIGRKITPFSAQIGCYVWRL